MTTPFDALAHSYHSLWSGSEKGREQRNAVWREIDGLFRRGDRVLDLGCGTGDDALHLAELGVEVTGIDAAPKMVEVARGRGLDARVLSIEHLSDLPAGFSGALSNFGALNCVRELDGVAGQLARLIQTGGPLAICLMGCFCWGDWSHAIGRWRGHARWQGMDIYYPSARRVRAAFAPWFALERRVAIGRGDHQLYILRRKRAC